MTNDQPQRDQPQDDVSSRFRIDAISTVAIVSLGARSSITDD